MRPRAAARAIALLSALAALGLALVYLAWPEGLLRAELARQALIARAERQSAHIDNERWVWFEGGEGPPIVLVHGFSGSKENWLPTMAALVTTHRVLAPDLPGWGESERRDHADYGIEAQACRLARFLDARALRGAHLVGHSMGGHIVGTLAALEPDLAVRITLVAPAGLRFRENDFGRRVLAGETPFNVRDRRELGAFFSELFVHPPWLPPRLADAYVARNRRDHAFQRTLLAQLAAPEARFALEARLAHVPVPLTVVWCDGDRILDPSALDTVARVAPRARRVRLEDCGHMPMMERPEALAEILR